ncbi:metal ABC transporter ATP-binding protein [Fuchsiella alkaliacetigena]|uniref:metal ABC transporter ATP-binding protein n=1 Tax=Fuchsiella alkaliacetigena TaxID=957042 RepID=UPI00200B0AA9|nr:metal ABC transporter ATP-binding protein [Fuchsiella alkaliacetigena]MCK8825202.1 metal ABC transporter ATP-binding protein [Fuchsiella alkaliacetigena]
MEAVVELEEVTVSYNEEPVLKEVSFSISQGEKVGIIGPNGAGKSTLIKAIMGLLAVDQGNIKVLGGSIDENRKKVAYIPQKEKIDWDFPISVEEVVMMGRYAHLGLFKRPQKEDRQLVNKSLEEVGMAEYKERQLGKLSGGQKQRVFLARALAQGAEILLLDEPFAGVDQTTQEAIYALLAEISEQGKTVIVVNHDLKRVEEYFENLVLINQRLIAYGTAETVFTHQHLQEAFTTTQKTKSAQKELVVIG